MKSALALLDAVLTLNIALAIHPQKDKNAVVRKTARRLVLKQAGPGKEYIALLICSQHPYDALCALEQRLEELRP